MFVVLDSGYIINYQNYLSEVPLFIIVLLIDFNLTTYSDNIMYSDYFVQDIKKRKIRGVLKEFSAALSSRDILTFSH